MVDWLVVHHCAVAFWFGVLGAEFVIERSRTESKPHGFAVARNHYWIDLFLEVPAALLVLASGLALLDGVQLTTPMAVKVAAGAVAVGINLYCVLPVLRRKAAADAGDLEAVIRQSRTIDRVAVLGVPAGVIALAIGALG